MFKLHLSQDITFSLILKGREGKGREGKRGKRGKGREGKGGEGREREGKGRGGKGCNIIYMPNAAKKIKCPLCPVPMRIPQKRGVPPRP